MNWDLGKLYTGFDDPAFARDMDALSAGAAQLKTAIANVREATSRRTCTPSSSGCSRSASGWAA